jgi:hypothetical protein
MKSEVPVVTAWAGPAEFRCTGFGAKSMVNNNPVYGANGGSDDDQNEVAQAGA